MQVAGALLPGCPDQRFQVHVVLSRKIDWKSAVIKPALNSPLKKPPGEGTGPTTHADWRVSVVGRVSSRGEQAAFQRTAKHPLQSRRSHADICSLFRLPAGKLLGVDRAVCGYRAG